MAAPGVWTQDFQQHVDQPRPAWGTDGGSDLSSAATRASTTLPLQVRALMDTQACKKVTRRHENYIYSRFSVIASIVREVSRC